MSGGSAVEFLLMDDARPTGWSTEISGSGEASEMIRGGSDESSSFGLAEGPSSPSAGGASVRVDLAGIHHPT